MTTTRFSRMSTQQWSSGIQWLAHFCALKIAKRNSLQVCHLRLHLLLFVLRRQLGGEHEQTLSIQHLLNTGAHYYTQVVGEALHKGNVSVR